MPDPAAVVGSEEQIRRAFLQTWQLLCRRLELFASLPMASLDRLALQQRLQQIGQS